jgi:hypothetical protein
VGEPTLVVVERSAAEEPRRKLQWYTTFWQAVSNVNIPMAWTLADTHEERSFAEALLALERGNHAEADSTIVPLLRARDTVIRDAARVTYGALLSSQSQWSRLSAFADAMARDPHARDPAGVETWARTFANAQTVVEFTDSVTVLPLSRTTTGAPVIAVRVNGVLKYFWLDTGSSISILSSFVATASGVQATDTNTLELLTAVGRIPVHPAITSLLQVGPLQIKNLPSMIVDTTHFTIRGTSRRGRSPIVTRLDGVIGFDVIRRADITIDDARERVIIRKPVVRAAPASQPRNLFWFGVPIVTLVSERGTVLHFSLDTGAEETYGTRLIVAKAGTRMLKAERRSVNGFGGETREQGVVVPRMRLFVRGVPLLFERMFLYRAQYPTIFELDGTLGSDVGRGGKIRIDVTNGVFEVAP